MSEREDLRRRVGQLLWFGFEDTAAGAEIRGHLRAGRCGGVTLFRRNLAELPGGELDLDALDDLVGAVRGSIAAGEAPPLISVDQEGGRVQRFRSPATRWPPMLSLEAAGAERGPELAAAAGRAMGDELAALDIDVDFAPVLDVHTNPANPIIGDRAFATAPELAAELALAFAGGLAAAGVLGCGKHFPGHGDTATDSHLELPQLDADLERLESVELLPFARAAATDPPLPMIMTAHVVFTALDPQRPATLSPRVLDAVLRRRLGYRGVVVSDDLDMGAVVDHWGVAEAAERAVLAGCDVLLLCRDPEHQVQAYERLIRAAEAKSDLRRRVGEAAARVESLKRAHFAKKRRRPERRVLGCAEFQAIASEMRALAASA